MRIYVSGPMTGLPDLNFPAFHEAAKRLRAFGHKVVNPAELDLDDAQAMTWAQYLRRDIRALMNCEAVALLPGWEASRGAALELHNARELGMTVLPVDSDLWAAA